MNKFKAITPNSVYVKALRIVINTEDEISRKLSDGKLNLLETIGFTDNIIAAVSVIRQAVSLKGQWANFDLSEEEVDGLAKEYAGTFGVELEEAQKIIDHGHFAMKHLISLCVRLKEVKKRNNVT